MSVTVKDYSRIQEGVERLLKIAIKDIEDEDLQVRILSALIKVKELLSDG